MSLIKERTCSECGKTFTWSIDRPGDGFWDRWRNDSGDTLASWFVSNTRCFDHAMKVIPQKFKTIMRTVTYEEFDPKGR